MTKVSIIIPVYNAAEYIKATIESVLRQTYEDWEIIAVDDCSQDNSCEIIESFNDDRIQCLRQKKNCGPAIARNVGIDKSVGEYLAFVDSDDTIDEKFVERMVIVAEHTEADVVWCNYYEIHNGRSELRTHGYNAITKIPQADVLNFFYDAHTGIGCLWNKMYRKAFIENHHLRINPKRFHGEDWEFNLDVFKNSPNVVAIEDSLYNYVRQNTNSVVSVYHASDFYDLTRTIRLLNSIAVERNIEYDKKAMYERTIYMIITLLVKLNCSEMKDKYAEMLRIRRDEFVKHLLDEGIHILACLTMKQKIYFLMFKMNLFTLCSIVMKRFR